MSERLTLQDLIDLLADKQGITKKDSETFIRELVGVISDTITEKDFVRVKDFGTFKLTAVKPRKSVDVNTGEAIEIPAHYKLSFVPEKVLREAVNRPFAHFESIVLDDEVVFQDKAEPKQSSKEEAPKKVVAKKVEPKVEATKPAAITPSQEEKSSSAPDNKIPAATKSDSPKVVVKAAAVELTENELLEEEKTNDINSLLANTVEQDSSKKEEDKSVQSKKIYNEPVRSTSYPRQDEEDDDDDYINYLAEEKKKRNRWIGIAIGVLLVLGVAYWGYGEMSKPRLPENVAVAQDNANITISVSDKEGEVSTTSGNETLSTPETPEISIPETTPTTAESSKLATDEQPQQASSQSAAPKEIEVKLGQTMRQLGREYYGHDAFWVYIFEENRDRIKSPDAIYAKMKLKVAPASKYGIDPKDPASVRKAEREEMRLFGEFSEK